MTATDVILRQAMESDAPALLDIFNDVLLHSDAIWLDEPVDIEDRLAWMRTRQAAGFPIVVAVAGPTYEGGGQQGQVLGYASYGHFRALAGYDVTVESSIHIRDGHRSQGIGQLLLDSLIERARAAGKAVMVAGIDGANRGSVRFHERNGFREVARMPGIGRKRGRPVDLLLFQRELQP